MLNALLLLVVPVSTWNKIAEARRGLAFVLLLYLVPLLLVSTAGEYYGLTHWGKQRGEFGKPTLVPAASALRYEAVRAGLGLLTVFGGALLLNAIARNLNPRHHFAPAFTVAAYALGPFFLAQLLLGLPFMAWWGAWLISMALAAGALYQGVPRVIQPDPSQTIGLYFMSVLALTGLTVISAYLASKFLTYELQSAVTSTVSLPR